jgi:molybdenum cofactor cytidylyltransferase
MKLSHALRVQRSESISLVGGGGKTTAMFRLAKELAAAGWRVVATTTTHIGAAQLAWESAPSPVILANPTAPAFPALVLVQSPVLLVGEIDPQTEKARGLSPELVDRIIPVLGADVVINEADGARLLPFKAPAAHEPVIPSGTTLAVPVVGIDVLGRPLDSTYVHRPERVAVLTGAELGQPVTLEMVAAVLGHPDGGLKGVLPHARVVTLINKVASNAELEAANQLAGHLLRSPQIAAAAIGAVRGGDPIRRVCDRVAVVVLAAGESRRFGRLKQLEPWGEGTLLSHATDTALASRADRVVVVLGCEAAACRAALGTRPLTIVTNPDWALGQSTSMQAGLVALPAHIGAAIFHLVDQPGVTAGVIDALIERHETTLAPVIWPEYRGRRGNPVLFDRRTFAELHGVQGDVGGKPVLMAYARAGAAERVAVDEPGVLLDIDKPEDLSRI